MFSIQRGINAGFKGVELYISARSLANTWQKRWFTAFHSIQFKLLKVLPSVKIVLPYAASILLSIIKLYIFYETQ